MLGNEIAAMKKTLSSYRLLYSLQHHLDCWRLCCWKENHLELWTTSQLSYSGGWVGGGGVQYKFVVSKLHCKLRFMSTFVSEGNSVTNCQVLILKINMSYLPINVFTNCSHDLFLISERNLEREKNKMKTIFLVNESVSFYVIAFKPSVVTRYCYISGLASFCCCWLLFYLFI